MLQVRGAGPPHTWEYLIPRLKERLLPASYGPLEETPFECSRADVQQEPEARRQDNEAAREDGGSCRRHGERPRRQVRLLRHQRTNASVRHWCVLALNQWRAPCPSMRSQQPRGD